MQFVPPCLQLEQQRRSSTGSSGSPAAGKARGDGDGERQLYSFADLFKAIRIEDFSSCKSLSSRHCRHHGRLFCVAPVLVARHDCQSHSGSYLKQQYD